MTGGFGAGFFAATLLVVLGGVAGLGTLVAAGTFLAHRRWENTPAAVGSVAVALLAVGVGIAAFGVALLVDEASGPAVLVAVVVLLPVGTAGARVRMGGDPSWSRLLHVVALAWPLPCLAGILVFLAVSQGVTAALGLAPAEPGRTDVLWLATAAAGTVATGGAVLLGDRVGRAVRREVPA